MIQGIAAMSLGVKAGIDEVYAAPSSQKKKVVRIFLTGGMSHLDSFDPKPQSPEVMGNTEVIRTNTGEQISSYFPMLAKRMDKVALIRSMYSPDAAHDRAHYLLETSYAQLGTIKHPFFGAWMQKLNGVINPALPASVNINNNYGGGYLGTAYDAFVVKNPKDALKGLVLEDPKSEKA